MRTKELIKAIEDLLELIDNGTLVRDISHDDDFMYFTKQGVKINNALNTIMDELEYLKLIDSQL